MSEKSPITGVNMKQSQVDPAELSALRLIAYTATQFVDAVEREAKVQVVATQVPQEWERLADTVLLLRLAARV